MYSLWKRWNELRVLCIRTHARTRAHTQTSSSCHHMFVAHKYTQSTKQHCARKWMHTYVDMHIHTNLCFWKVCTQTCMCIRVHTASEWINQCMSLSSMFFIGRCHFITNARTHMHTHTHAHSFWQTKACIATAPWFSSHINLLALRHAYIYTRTNVSYKWMLWNSMTSRRAKNKQREATEAHNSCIVGDGSSIFHNAGQVAG